MNISFRRARFLDSSTQVRWGFGSAGVQGYCAEVDALDRWSELVRTPAADFPLDEAALLISACANPGLDVEGQLARLDDLARLVTTPTTEGVCRLLFDELEFAGDRDNYGDPINSYLDRVLDRRRGIPITLSVLLVEIARRRGIALEGVGMPGHFLVRDPASPEMLIDCFDKGRRLDRSDCEHLLTASTGATRLMPEMMATTTKPAILIRMLANLDRSFADRKDHASLEWVCDMRLSLPAASLADRLQLADRLATLGRIDAAVDVLEQASAASSGEAVRARLHKEANRLLAPFN